MALARNVAIVLVALVSASSLLAHPHHHGSLPSQEASTPAPGTIAPGAKGVSGQGTLRFRVLLTAAQLPEEARKVVVSAHGGFAVDHRPGQEETYFALPGAGILRMSADLKEVVLVPTAPEMKGTNLHNTAIWYGPDGTAYLTFPANDAGRVFTTSLGGELLNTLTSPTGDDDLGLPSVRTISRGAARSVTAWSGGVPRSEDYSRPRAARPGRSASERIAGTAMPQHELD